MVNDVFFFLIWVFCVFIQVSHNTAISLARRSRMLHTLDLSWCRNLTDEAIGFIVDSCLSLRVLKLFGCTQVSVFYSTPGWGCKVFENYGRFSNHSYASFEILHKVKIT